MWAVAPCHRERPKEVKGHTSTGEFQSKWENYGVTCEALDPVGIMEIQGGRAEIKR